VVKKAVVIVFNPPKPRQLLAGLNRVEKRRVTRGETLPLEKPQMNWLFGCLPIVFPASTASPVHESPTYVFAPASYC
jgi:hypothetical protein